MPHNPATPDPSTLTVDALATAIYWLMAHDCIAEAWILYGLAEEPKRLSMRLLCYLMNNPLYKRPGFNPAEPLVMPRCLGLFPSDGRLCPYRESCLHYTEGTDAHGGYWVPRTEGSRCFDRETDLGATIGRLGC